MWFVIALVVGGFISALVLWLRSRDISLTWYEWLIGAVGLILLLFAIQNLFGSLAEDEITAAYMYLLITGLPGFILMALTWLLATRRRRAART